MVVLTPEQRQIVEQSGDEPVRIEDPETSDAYYLLKAEVFERVRDVIRPKSEINWEVPEGIRRSQAAFLRDLRGMLNDRNLARKWVAYHGDERIGIARTQRELVRECLRRGLKDDEYYVDMIIPYPMEPEEIEGGGHEFEEPELTEPSP